MNNNYKNALSFTEFQHENFKLQWMLTHSFTLLDLIKGLEQLQEDNSDISLMELFEEWEFNRGFGGAIWPCYDEWLETEGKEVE